MRSPPSKSSSTTGSRVRMRTTCSKWWNISPAIGTRAAASRAQTSASLLLSLLVLNPLSLPAAAERAAAAELPSQQRQPLLVAGGQFSSAPLRPQTASSAAAGSSPWPHRSGSYSHGGKEAVQEWRPASHRTPQQALRRSPGCPGRTSDLLASPAAVCANPLCHLALACTEVAMVASLFGCQPSPSATTATVGARRRPDGCGKLPRCHRSPTASIGLLTICFLPVEVSAAMQRARGL